MATGRVLLWIAGAALVVGSLAMLYAQASQSRWISYGIAVTGLVLLVGLFFMGWADRAPRAAATEGVIFHETQPAAVAAPFPSARPVAQRRAIVSSDPLPPAPRATRTVSKRRLGATRTRTQRTARRHDRPARRAAKGRAADRRGRAHGRSRKATVPRR